MWKPRSLAAGAALVALLAWPAHAQIPTVDPSEPIGRQAQSANPETVAPVTPQGGGVATPQDSTAAAAAKSGKTPAAAATDPVKPAAAKPKPDAKPAADKKSATKPVDCKSLYEAACRETASCVWIAEGKNADSTPAAAHCQKKGTSAAAKPAAAAAAPDAAGSSAASPQGCTGMYEAGCRETTGCVWIADTKNADGSAATPHCQKKAGSGAASKPKPKPAATADEAKAATKPAAPAEAAVTPPPSPKPPKPAADAAAKAKAAVDAASETVDRAVKVAPPEPPSAPY